jgi:hypothetical protein
MVQPANAETAKQSLIKNIMRDDSITQQEKQLRVQVSMCMCVYIHTYIHTHTYTYVYVHTMYTQKKNPRRDYAARKTAARPRARRYGRSLLLVCLSVY